MINIVKNEMGGGTILRYMDEGEEKSVVQSITHLKHEIKSLYGIDCMI